MLEDKRTWTSLHMHLRERMRRQWSRRVNVSKLSENIQVGISHVTAFDKLSGQRPEYIKRKYDHGSHMKCISTSKYVGDMHNAQKEEWQ